MLLRLFYKTKKPPFSIIPSRSPLLFQKKFLFHLICRFNKRVTGDSWRKRKQKSPHFQLFPKVNSFVLLSNYLSKSYTKNEKGTNHLLDEKSLQVRESRLELPSAAADTPANLFSPSSMTLTTVPRNF